MSADLIFGLPPDSSGDLVFGENPTTADVELTITGSFAPLTVAVHIADLKFANITGSFAPLTAALVASYSSSTARPTVGQRATQWQEAQADESGPVIGQQSASKAPVGWETFWERTVGTPAIIRHPLPSVFESQRTDLAARHQDGTTTQRGVSFGHQDGVRVHRPLSGGFQDGVKVRNDTLFRHQNADHTKRNAVASKYQEATGRHAILGSSMQKALRLLVERLTRYQEGVPPPAGESVIVPPVIPPNTCYIPSANLLFKDVPLEFGNLVFICDNYTPPPVGNVVVPVKRVYIVLNTVNLFRVSDNAPVPALSMSLSLDVDSWTWSFNATLPAVAQSLVEPTGSSLTELKAMVNGTEFRVLAESVGRDRTFGQTTIKVSGRGRNAILDAPYAAAQNFSNTVDRTAQQLMNDVLTISGVPLGWDVDWELEDWLVPAGVFNHQGTYISALNAIAQAAGGSLLPHNSAQSFKVKHRYPLAPWEWASATPDFSIPADVATQEGIEWIDKALYNRVYVSGESQGVLGNIKRDGTAGDLVAQMITDPLITEGAAARQRGLVVLADTGLQALVTLRMPVLSETGILVPGHMVDYVDGATTRRGIVRSTQVSVGGEADVWQTFGLETHV